MLFIFFLACYAGPVAAGLVNKFGCRAVAIAGSLSATVAMFVSAFMPTIGLMLFTYGIVAGTFPLSLSIFAL